MRNEEKTFRIGTSIVKGIIMAAIILPIKQVYIQMKTGQQLSREALVSGIRESH